MYSRDGIEHEVTYWRKVLKTYSEIAPRLDKQSTVSHAFQLLLSEFGYNVLEFGCGPASGLGYKVRHGAQTISFTYADPLANSYYKIWESVGLQPPHAIVACEGEQLAHHFAGRNFDIVAGVNCLDHAREPLEVLRNALDCMRTGGAIYLVHSMNEASKAQGLGLHQYNIFEADKRPKLKHLKGNAVDIVECLAGGVYLHSLTVHENDWLSFVLVKT